MEPPAMESSEKAHRAGRSPHVGPQSHLGSILKSSEGQLGAWSQQYRGDTRPYTQHHRWHWQRQGGSTGTYERYCGGGYAISSARISHIYAIANDRFVSAFDPIFFLHHCNVDRIFAAWQALHPDTWVTPGTMTDKEYSGTTLTENWGSEQNATSSEYTYHDSARDYSSVGRCSDLTPFWRTDTAYWTSDDCRDAAASLHYSYDQLPLDLTESIPTFPGFDSDMSAASSIEPAGASLLTESTSQPSGQQGGGAGVAGRSDSHASPTGAAGHLPADIPPQDTSSLASPVAAFGPTAPQGPITVPDAMVYKQWSARVCVDKESLGASFEVTIYLIDGHRGTPPTEDDIAGSFMVFVNSRRRQCDNCNNQRGSDALVEGYVEVRSSNSKEVEPAFNGGS